MCLYFSIASSKQEFHKKLICVAPTGQNCYTNILFQSLLVHVQATKLSFKTFVKIFTDNKLTKIGSIYFWQATPSLNWLNSLPHMTHSQIEARCNSVVRVFAHGAISHSSQCCTTGVPKAVIWAVLSLGWCI